MTVNKLKVLIVSTGLSMSGAERVIYYICKELSKNLDVILLTNEEIVNFYSGLNIQIESFGPIDTNGIISTERTLTAYKKTLIQIIHKHQPNIIHAHSDLPIRLIGRTKTSTPIIITFHGTDLYHFTHKRNPIYWLTVGNEFNRAISQAKYITTVSKQMLISSKLSQVKNAITVSNGVDINVFKRFIPLQKRTDSVIFAGRLIDIKGINEIMAVVRMLPNTNFYFAGSGPLESIVNGENAIKLGQLGEAQLAKEFNKHRMAIFLSHHEGFPLIGLESMASGTVPIATNDGFSEYITSNFNGFIVDKDDAIGISNLIRQNINNPLLSKMSDSSHLTAQKYSWGKVATKYMTLYRKALDNK